MDIEQDPDVRIERDGDSVRQVLHLARPYTHGAATTASHLAALYLHQHAELFDLDPSSLPSVSGMPARSFTAALAAFLRGSPVLGRLFWPWMASGIQLGLEPRLVTVRSGESTAVIFPQVRRVHFSGWGLVDLAVWGAGIRLMVALSPLRLTVAYSTLRRELPSVVRSARFPTTVEAAARAFNIPLDTVEGLFAYGSRQSADTLDHSPDLASVLVYGRQDDPKLGRANRGRLLPYREYLALLSGAVVRRDVLASRAVGLAFRVDPRSKTAWPEPGPYRPESDLDPHRDAIALRSLTPPVLGAQQELRGSRVYVARDNPLGIEPPKEPLGASFNYSSRLRSNHFAAVSAYHHCDAAFRMVEALAFPLADYFAANVAARQFPIRVVHRAPIRPGSAVFDGRTVNAQVLGDPVPNVVGEIRFALGDLSDTVTGPLGIAADVRFAWHEFSHALLIAATGQPELVFAHSAGDALAAIICDLDSRIGELAPPSRGVTFPWVEALRRHDRAVTDGWGWHGSLYPPRDSIRDPGAYRAEQILSSTLFRLYRALGGDAVRGDNAPDLVARRAAAAYAVYLIVAAIKALGPVATTPALDAYALAGQMMDADIATTVLFPDRHLFRPFRARPRRGGAVHKVVRWAFERQGLYAPGSGPRLWDAPGAPPPLDVYIEDRQGRRGQYDYTTDWDTQHPDVRVAALPNPVAVDAPPKRNMQSHVFVRVHNRGPDPAPPAATVRVFFARGPAVAPPHWRLAPGPLNRWRELVAGSGATTTAIVPPGPPETTFVDFGPFAWRPVLAGPHALLAFVDAPGDRCNALASNLACATGPTPIAHLVPFDNNSGYRRVIVLP
jgi:hypothetical protein